MSIRVSAWVTFSFRVGFKVRVRIRVSVRVRVRVWATCHSRLNDVAAQEDQGWG